MVTAHALTDRRVLMESHFGWVWYLGERIRGWTEGVEGRSVPPPPPFCMFWASSLIGCDDEADFRAGTIIPSVGGSYSAFMRRRLLPSMPPHVQEIIISMPTQMDEEVSLLTVFELI